MGTPNPLADVVNRGDWVKANLPLVCTQITLADDAEVELCDSADGDGDCVFVIYTSEATDGACFLIVGVDISGPTTELFLDKTASAAAASIGSITDADAKVCVYPTGTKVMLKNRLGESLVYTIFRVSNPRS